MFFNRVLLNKKRMKIIQNILLIVFSLVIISQEKSTQANEKFNCDSSSIKVYDKEFKCDNLNDYFLNEFYSNYLSRSFYNERGNFESNFIKQSSFAQITDWLGLYTKRIDGVEALRFGFGDQKISKDSEKLWKAFNQEFDKLIKEPIKTNNLNNGFNSSIFEESI